MRKIHIFILRLVTTTDEPQRLRGAVRALNDDREYTFVNDQSLLDLLHQMCPTSEPCLLQDQRETTEERGGRG